MVDDTMPGTMLSDAVLTLLANNLQWAAEEFKQHGLSNYFFTPTLLLPEVRKMTADALSQAFKETIPEKRKGVNPTVGDWNHQIHRARETLKKNLKGLSDDDKKYVIELYDQQLMTYKAACRVDFFKVEHPDHNDLLSPTKRIASRSGVSEPQATISDEGVATLTREIRAAVEYLNTQLPDDFDRPTISVWAKDMIKNDLVQALELLIPHSSKAGRPTVSGWNHMVKLVRENLKEPGLMPDIERQLMLNYFDQQVEGYRSRLVDFIQRPPVAPPDPPQNLVSFAEYRKKMRPASNPPADPEKTR